MGMGGESGVYKLKNKTTKYKGFNYVRRGGDMGHGGDWGAQIR